MSTSYFQITGRVRRRAAEDILYAMKGFPQTLKAIALTALVTGGAVLVVAVASPPGSVATPIVGSIVFVAALLLARRRREVFLGEFNSKEEWTRFLTEEQFRHAREEVAARLAWRLREARQDHQISSLEKVVWLSFPRDEESHLSYLFHRDLQRALGQQALGYEVIQANQYLWWDRVASNSNVVLVDLFDVGDGMLKETQNRMESRTGQEVIALSACKLNKRSRNLSAAGV